MKLEGFGSSWDVEINGAENIPRLVDLGYLASEIVRQEHYGDPMRKINDEGYSASSVRRDNSYYVRVQTDLWDSDLMVVVKKQDSSD